MSTHLIASSTYHSGHGGNLCHFSFVDGAFVEITGEIDARYRVQFFDSDSHELVHEDEISTNHWVRTSRQYFVRWLVLVFNVADGQLLWSHDFDCRNQRVYIAMESKALGDTLAWFQALEDFQRQHDCELICSTFMNELLEDQYPHLTFVKPGETVHNLYAMYRIGWFYLPDGRVDFNKNVRDFKQQPLAQSATDILGLPFVDQRPRIKTGDPDRPLPEKYVCIAVHSTAQAKYWNHPTGWQDVVSHLRQWGYQVVLLSREGVTYMGNQAPTHALPLPAGDLAVVITYLRHAALFIGVGSGLSWLSWAVGCPTCVISGFSYPFTEAKEMIRVSARPGDCSGCFNRHTLDASDWHWCPDHQNTPRMFECTRNIGPDQVLQALSPYLNAV